jgi:hypothetical protein
MRLGTVERARRCTQGGGGKSDRFKRLVSKNKANKKAGALKVFLTTSSIVYPTFAKNF